MGSKYPISKEAVLLRDLDAMAKGRYEGSAVTLAFRAARHIRALRARLHHETYKLTNDAEHQEDERVARH